MVRVCIENGPTFEVGSSDTILKAALRGGIGFPHECSVGGCGSCKFELLEGKLETAWDLAPGLSERDRKRGRHLACQCKPVGDISIRAHMGNEYVPLVEPRVIETVLIAKKSVTHDMTEFTFSSSNPAHFLPGQYALLGMPVPGSVRAYSMSNTQNEDGIWQFIVRMVPNGCGTHFLFNDLEIGSTLQIDGPYGLAWLRPVKRDVVCIAGGSGLAPMLSIARAAAPGLKAEGRCMHFFYGGRSPRDLAAGPLIAALPGFGQSLRFHEAISHPVDGGEWLGHVSYIHDLVSDVLGDGLREHEVYFAGPPPMAMAVQDRLMGQHKVPFSQIHYDRFF